jgi:hypothetical protein
LHDTENVTRSVTKSEARPAGSDLVTQPDGYVTIREDMSVLIGYLRVSKADGSQTPDPQRDTPAEDQDSGRETDLPSSATCLAAFQSQEQVPTLEARVGSR